MHFQVLTQAITGIPARFVFNLDEIGHQAWVDALNKVCCANGTRVISQRGMGEEEQERDPIKDNS
jgi:hypothetical protein